MPDDFQPIGGDDFQSVSSRPSADQEWAAILKNAKASAGASANKGFGQAFMEALPLQMRSFPTPAEIAARPPAPVSQLLHETFLPGMGNEPNSPVSNFLHGIPAIGPGIAALVNEFGSNPMAALGHLAGGSMMGMPAAPGTPPMNLPIGAAARGAWQGATEPTGFRGFEFPASLVNAVAGTGAAKAFGLPPELGAIGGAVYPMVRGAIRGVKSAGPAPEMLTPAAARLEQVATPNELLNQIASGMGKKTFDQLTELQQQRAMQIAKEMGQQPKPAGMPPTPTQTAESVETHPFDPHREATATLFKAQAAAKDLNVAKRLQSMGLDPTKMSDAELSSHYTAMGYKGLGKGGPHGRPADIGRIDLIKAWRALK